MYLFTLVFFYLILFLYIYVFILFIYLFDFFFVFNKVLSKYLLIIMNISGMFFISFIYSFSLICFKIQ